ncbi:MAG: hypothetical protein BWY52_02628 [Chloroflexi bacterium ADurb.Bin325]|nr:MAG: hypothetical protein BWY52_02628 [Chloroflexi bacterium ADurb.Bin325]
MNDIIIALRDALRTALIWELNGLLALVYTAWAHLAALATAGAYTALLFWTPPGRRSAHAVQDQLSGQRPWLLGIGCAVILAAFLAPAPMPVLLAVMTVAGTAAVKFDRFNPTALRWRVVGGLALYALASLAYLGYGRYLNALDATAWAEAIGGRGEAALALAQGRAFINTLATWGLWLILPLGYLSLLAQGVLIHPPLPATPEQVITAVRTRGQSR